MLESAPETLPLKRLISPLARGDGELLLRDQNECDVTFSNDIFQLLLHLCILIIDVTDDCMLKGAAKRLK